MQSTFICLWCSSFTHYTLILSVELVDRPSSCLLIKNVFRTKLSSFSTNLVNITYWHKYREISQKRRIATVKELIWKFRLLCFLILKQAISLMPKIIRIRLWKNILVVVVFYGFLYLVYVTNSTSMLIFFPFQYRKEHLFAKVFHGACYPDIT